MSDATGLEIAVLSAAGRFPGAASVDELWTNLCTGVEAIRRFDRDELEAEGIEAARLDHPNFVPAAAVVEGANLFDAGLFDFTPREAEITDPQHRLFLECCWEALERAGYGRRRHRGTVGVFAGAARSTYLRAAEADPELFASLGGAQLELANNRDFLATRVAYKLDLSGSAITIQTACSTSLVAIHLACEALLNGEGDMALAGGVSLRFPQKSGYLFREGGITSPDGHCRVFDERAAGTVGGNGAAVVLLKRLDDALAAGDVIRGVVKGSAVNNDGARKVGYTAPSIEGQAEVIRAALHFSEVDPASIAYVEAHGTGTALGDPIEVAALRRAFTAPEQAPGSCALGSIKSNLGHLDAAAGAAGFIKAMLAVEGGKIPPSLHFERPNPRLELDCGPFRVASRLEDWPDRSGPRRAAVSSFGIGGTNAHVIVEQAPEVAPSGPSRSHQVLVLSARTKTALATAADRLADHLEGHREQSLADVASTLQRGREALDRRAFLVVENREGAIAGLRQRDPATLRQASTAPGSRSLAFLFPGQGAQHPGMGRGLYEAEPTFRGWIDRAAEILAPLRPDRGVRGDLRRWLFPVPDDEAEAAERLRGTALAQPALFAVEHALARLWLEWGARPEAMIGHSIGEFVAACLAGIFSFEDALTVVAHRGRLMAGLPPGAMLAVPWAEEKLVSLIRLLDEDLWPAAFNGPSSSVVSGTEEAIDRLAAKLADDGADVHRLRTSHAFHSPMMEPILEAFGEVVAGVELRPPEIPFIASPTGTWIEASEATDPAYWVRQLREPVRFSAGVAALLAEPARVFLEVGPGRTLSALVRQHPEPNSGTDSGTAAGETPARVVVPSMPHPQDPETETETALAAQGELWLAGVEVDWDGLITHENRRRVELPPYPFERRRFRLDTRATASLRRPAMRREDPADWFYLPLWQQAPPALAHGRLTERVDPAGSEDWLVFSDGSALAEALIAHATATGSRVVTVLTGKALERLGPTAYRLDPSSGGDYERLFDEATDDSPPRRILHLWSLSGNGEDLRFLSLLRLARALGVRFAEEAIDLSIVSTGLVSITGEEVLRPENATLLGPARAMPLEYPRWRCRVVDVPEQGTGPGDVGGLVAGFEAVFRERSAEPWIALRGARRWRPIYQPVPLPPIPPRGDEEEATAAETSGLRDGGVYWITGGLGGVGLALAERLARRFAARLILTGRIVDRDRDREGRSQALRSIEEAGAEVLVAAADVTDEASMRAAALEARKRWGKIHGVIHAAGLAGGGLLQFLDEGEALATLAPKVEGARVLARLFEDGGSEDGKPDFLVLCSSLASVVGGAGQADYVAANAFLDLFAAERAGRRPRTLAIHWDTWREAGMAARAPGGAVRIGQGLSNDQGAEALVRALTHLPAEQSRVLVSVRDPASLGGPATEGEIGAGRDPEGTTEGQDQPGGTTETIASLWRELLGVAAVGPGDDFFQLGGHSLLATQLMTRLQESFGVDLPLRTIFDAPTVTTLAAVVDDRRTWGDRGDRRAARAAESESDPREEPAGEDAPLSFAQQRLWFLDRLEPGTAAYNMPGAFRLRGRLDEDALGRGLAEIARRHEVLRSAYPADADGKARVVTTASEDFAGARLPSVDLTALPPLPETERLETARRLAAEEAATPFDLARGPLMRATLLRLAEDDHILLLTLHHAVSDFWSMGIFLRELAALYGAFNADSTSLSPLASPPMQYADFARWQRCHLEGGVLEDQIAYWKERLGGDPPILELPADRPRPPVHSTAGAQVRMKIRGEPVRRLRELCRDRGVTLFMALLAVYKVLLYRYTGQEDLLVGFPIANRGRREAEELIGFFVNTLVLRTRLSPGISFGELLDRVQVGCLEAYEHRDLPFERLVDELDLKRDLGHTPLFQTFFVFQNATVGMPELPGLEIAPFDLPVRSAQFDLTLEISEAPAASDGTGDELRGGFEFRTDLFDTATVESLAGHFETLLAAAVANPAAPIASLPMLADDERRRIVEEWSGKAVRPDAPTPVFERIRAAAEREPDRPAVVAPEGSLTYGQLMAETERLAARLRRRGIGIDDRVAVLLERSGRRIAAVLAVLAVGAAYVPIAPGTPARRRSWMLRDAGAELLLTESAVVTPAPAAAQSPEDGVETWSLDLDSAEEPPGNDLPTPGPISDLIPGLIPDRALAYVIYTSGSTGEPKGVPVPRRALDRFSAAAIAEYELVAEDRVLQFASLSFDASVEEIFPTLAAGATLVLRDELVLASPRSFLEACRERGVTVLDLPTSYWHELARSLEAEADELDGLELPASLRLTILGGERALAERVPPWRRAAPGARLVNTYGPTEATVVATRADLSGRDDEPLEDRREPPIGRPLPGCRAYVLDSTLEPLPAGVIGELHLGGASLARGYLGRPAQTAERFIPDPFSGRPGARVYKSGDLARWRSDGHLEFAGRRDAQVKVRGYRIEPGEIEARLLAHPQVQEAAVQADRALGPDQADRPESLRLIAWAAPRVPVAELRAYLSEQLPAYMVPSAFVTLDTLPKTSGGKVDRRALPAPDAPGPAADDAFVAPRNPTEGRLAQIWGEVLGAERVGTDDNFFDLGGDSILSIQIVARAKKADLDLAPRQLFEHQTIAELAAAIAGSPGPPSVSAEPAEQGQVQGRAPLTPIQRWFFEVGSPEPHHYNQSLLLELRRPLADGAIAAALSRLAEHHDALRSRFPKDDHAPQGRSWIIAPPDPETGKGTTVPFERFDLTALAVDRRPEILAFEIARLQGSLDLEKGPLLRATRFDLGPGTGGRLLLVAHHLVVDGVSWRILLEDLRTLLAAGDPAALPPKTTSFKRWAEILAEAAAPPELADEEAYWLRPPAAARPLPVDGLEGEDNEGSTQRVVRRLGSEETGKLLAAAPRTRGGLEVVMLTALVEAFAPWTGHRSLLVDLEGHGREEDLRGADRERLDLSRTVGWMTTVYPVMLDPGDAAPGRSSLEAVGTILEAVPRRGIGYGLLRYGPAGDPSTPSMRERLAARPRAEVSFNYLGRLDELYDPDAPFAPAAEAPEPQVSPSALRPYRLEIDASLRGGVLQTVWRYSANRHRRTTIETLADRFRAELAGIALSSADGGEPAGEKARRDDEIDADSVDNILAELEAD